MLGVVGKILARFGEGLEDMDIYGILAEYSVYHTPDYVYIKGKGELLFEDDPDSVINLSCLKQGIGLAGEDVGKVRIRKNSRDKEDPYHRKSDYFLSMAGKGQSDDLSGRLS